MRRLYNKRPFYGNIKVLYSQEFKLASCAKELASYKKKGLDKVEMRASFALDLKCIRGYNEPVKILANKIVSNEKYKNNSGAYKIYIKDNYLCFNGTSSTPLEDYKEIEPVYIFKIDKKVLRDHLIRGTDVHCNNILMPYYTIEETFNIIRSNLLNGFKIRKNNKIYFNPSPVVLSKTTIMMTLFTASPKPEGLSEVYSDIYIQSPI